MNDKPNGAATMGLKLADGQLAQLERMLAAVLGILQLIDDMKKKNVSAGHGEGDAR